MAAIGQRFLRKHRQRLRWLRCGKALNLNVKSMEFPAGRHKGDNQKGPDFARLFAAMAAEFGAAWKKTFSHDKGNPCLSPWQAGRSGVFAPVVSMRAWSGRAPRIWCCPSVPCRRPVN